MSAEVTLFVGIGVLLVIAVIGSNFKKIASYIQMISFREVRNNLKDTIQYSFNGISLRGGLSRLWSRRIDDKNRLIYKFNNNQLTIIACRYYYDKAH